MVSIEWAWLKPTKEFMFLNYWLSLKVELSPVATYYKLSILLSNAHTCLYGSQMGDKFGVEPPALEDYLNTN